jgi:hypothetical protein
MQSQTELLKQVSQGLKKGMKLVDSLYGGFPSPRFYLLSEELQFACKWIDGIHQQSHPDDPEKIPQIAHLLRNCAELARARESHFLAEEFDRSADDAKLLIPEFEALAGQSQ